MSLFFVGKTFYWVYLKHFQTEMIKNFGDFYTIVEAVVWIYFLACSFFYSASVTYEPIGMRKPKNNSDDIDKKDDTDITEMFEIPEDIPKAS